MSPGLRFRLHHHIKRVNLDPQWELIINSVAILVKWTTNSSSHRPLTIDQHPSTIIGRMKELWNYGLREWAAISPSSWFLANLVSGVASSMCQVTNIDYDDNNDNDNSSNAGQLFLIFVAYWNASSFASRFWNLFMLLTMNPSYSWRDVNKRRYVDTTIWCVRWDGVVARKWAAIAQLRVNCRVRVQVSVKLNDQKHGIDMSSRRFPLSYREWPHHIILYTLYIWYSIILLFFLFETSIYHDGIHEWSSSHTEMMSFMSSFFGGGS